MYDVYVESWEFISSCCNNKKAIHHFSFFSWIAVIRVIVKYLKRKIYIVKDLRCSLWLHGYILNYLKRFWIYNSPHNWNISFIYDLPIRIRLIIKIQAAFIEPLTNDNFYLNQSISLSAIISSNFHKFCS